MFRTEPAAVVRVNTERGFHGFAAVKIVYGQKKTAFSVSTTSRASCVRLEGCRAQ